MTNVKHEPGPVALTAVPYSAHCNQVARPDGAEKKTLGGALLMKGIG